VTHLQAGNELAQKSKSGDVSTRGKPKPGTGPPPASVISGDLLSLFRIQLEAMWVLMDASLQSLERRESISMTGRD
jgi:hypothetical protein